MGEGQSFKIREAKLETVCGITSTVPRHTLPEVAFAGKSNVGKSSLINTLLLRKSLARTSSQPGKTQTINFYHINAGEERADFAPDCFLVDLPGYGYANASQEIKAKWGTMIERYLKTSEARRCVFLLIDIRHDPSANDRLMYEWIVSNGMNPVIVATKKDKIKKSQLDRQLKAIRTGLGLKAGTRLLPFSSETREGREELWELILAETMGETDAVDH